MKKLLTLLVFVCLFSSSFFAQSTNFNEGKKALEAEDFDGALNFFTKDLADYPTSAMTFYYRAWVYYYKSENARALNDVNSGIKNTAKKEEKLKAAFYELRAKINIEIDEPTNALADYSMAIKLDATDDDYYVGRAQLYYDTEMLAKAEADYLAVLKLDETSARAFAGLGRNYVAQQKYVEADKILAKLKKLHPDYSTAYFYSAISQYKQGKFDAAIEESFQAFRLDDSDESNRDLFLDYADKNYPLALSKVSYRMKEEPGNPFWAAYKGILLQDKGDYSDAIPCFSLAIKLSDEAPFSLYSRRGRCYLSNGMSALAIKDYDFVLNNDSTRPYDYAYRADAKRLLGYYTEAIKDFTNAITLQPGDAWFYCRRGWVYEEFLKNNNAGLNDFNKAIEIDKTYAYTYLHRGRMYKLKLNEPQKAKDDFETILKLDTVMLVGGNCRHYALFELDRNKEAIDWMDKILIQFPLEGNYYDAACLYSLMKKSTESIKYITLAFENGYRDLTHLNSDDDLDNVRNMPQFKSVLEKWTKIINLELQNAAPKEETTTNELTAGTKNRTVVIPMIKKGSGTYEVACKINDLPLNFIFDTGASDISISQTEVQFMLKNNYLNKSDIHGTQQYLDANGNVELGTKIVLRKVEIGDFVLNNVAASVVNNNKAPLLFGQSALDKYGKIIIDNENKTITISNMKK